MFSKDNRGVLCDGEACTASAALPVALQSTLQRRSNSTAVRRGSIEGWLCVTVPGRNLHFCPDCAVCYLKETACAAPMANSPA